MLAIWRDPLESLAMADEQKTSTTAEGNANGEPRPHNKREDLFRSKPPVPAESENHSTLPSDLARDIAAKRWGDRKQKREAVLSEAESVARERWKNCDDDHAKMTSWLKNEYSPDNKTPPFLDDTLTKHLRKRMANVARDIGKPVRGEKKSPG